jgi:hypothetical protein
MMWMPVIARRQGSIAITKIALLKTLVTLRLKKTKTAG